MGNIRNKIIAAGLGIMVARILMSYINTYSVIIAEARSGRADSNGGHKDSKNKSGLDSYHYHCGGRPVYLHTGDVCPYVSDSAAASDAESASLSDKELVKKM